MKTEDEQTLQVNAYHEHRLQRYTQHHHYVTQAKIHAYGLLLEICSHV